MQLSNLGLLYRNNGMYEEAGEMLNKALAIYQRLHPGNPARYAPDVVNGLTNVAETEAPDR